MLNINLEKVRKLDDKEFRIQQALGTLTVFFVQFYDESEEFKRSLERDDPLIVAQNIEARSEDEAVTRAIVGFTGGTYSTYLEHKTEYRVRITISPRPDLHLYEERYLSIL